MTTSPATSVYPLLAGDAAEASQSNESACAPWATDFKASELGLDGLNLLSTYDALESSNSSGHNFSNESASYDYRLYDSFTFDGISNEALGSMTDHY